MAAGAAGEVRLYTFPQVTQTAEIACEFLWPAGSVASAAAHDPGSTTQTVPPLTEDHPVQTSIESVPPPPRIYDLQFESTGRYLAIAGERVVRVWDCERKVFTGPPLVHSESLEFVLFSPNSLLLVTVSSSSIFRVFSVTTPLDRTIWQGDHLACLYIRQPIFGYVMPFRTARVLGCAPRAGESSLRITGWLDLLSGYGPYT